MAVKKNNSFSRRLPDVVTKELVSVLSQKTSYEFKTLFEVVHDNLRRRNAAHGGEELLRLRAYEKRKALHRAIPLLWRQRRRMILPAGSSLKKRASQTRSARTP